jgi:phosphate transport system substrate-binding protein
MQPGCAALPQLARIDRGDDFCSSIREDGVYVEHATIEATVRRLETDPALFGVLSGGDFIFHQAKLAAAAFEGVSPTFETIASGTYPASRTLYVYTSRGAGSGKPGRTELVESYLRLPETGRALISPDNATRMEMWSRARLIVRTASTGDLR